jgi:hypothetical protein
MWQSMLQFLFLFLQWASLIDPYPKKYSLFEGSENK